MDLNELDRRLGQYLSNWINLQPNPYVLHVMQAWCEGSLNALPLPHAEHERANRREAMINALSERYSYLPDFLSWAAFLKMAAKAQQELIDF